MINPILNKGGAGVSLSRAATVERLNPIIEQHYHLNHAYEAAIRQLGSGPYTERFGADQRYARADIGKLAETVFSMGGVAYNGTELEPGHYDRTGSEDDTLFHLLDQEEDFQRLVSSEMKHKPQHQVRTLAILQNVQTHSQERLNFLREHTRTRRRATAQ